MTISSPLIDVASLPDVSTTAGKIADLKARRIDAASPVGRAAQKKVRDNGRLTARDRLDYLLDPHSFVEIDQLNVQAHGASCYHRPSAHWPV